MIRRILVPVLLVVVAIAAGAVVTSSSGSTITRPRLERSLPQVFTNLYTRQARIQGHPVIEPAVLGAQAMCDKHGPKVPDVGPGGDWTCLMKWNDPKVPMPPEGFGKFELNVHSNGCYTATGPTRLTGFLTISDAHGHDVTNPLFEFDGCFNPHGDNTATGVAIPSLLTVTSTALTPDKNGRIGITLSCSLGEKGCSGTATASFGGNDLGTATYNLEEGRTVTITVPAPSSSGNVTIKKNPQTGRASPPDTITYAPA